MVPHDLHATAGGNAVVEFLVEQITESRLPTRAWNGMNRKQRERKANRLIGCLSKNQWPNVKDIFDALTKGWKCGCVVFQLGSGFISTMGPKLRIDQSYNKQSLILIKQRKQICRFCCTSDEELSLLSASSGAGSRRVSVSDNHVMRNT